MLLIFVLYKLSLNSQCKSKFGIYTYIKTTKFELIPNKISEPKRTKLILENNACHFFQIFVYSIIIIIEKIKLQNPANTFFLSLFRRPHYSFLIAAHHFGQNQI